MRQVVLITGASTGIGKHCAAHLHALGYHVFGTSRRMAVSASQESYTMIELDVTDETSVTAAVTQVVAQTGRLDILINNAGYGLAGPYEETTVSEAQRQFDVNFFGVQRMIQAVLPTMRQQGSGLILTMSSLAGVIGLPFQSMYSASKFALEGALEALQLELNPFGIRLVLLQPGNFNTAFTANRQQTAVTNTHSPYARPFQQTLQQVELDERNGLSPAKVAELVAQIISSRNPKFRYAIGPWQETMVIPLRRLLPARLFTYFSKKAFGL